MICRVSLPAVTRPSRKDVSTSQRKSAEASSDRQSTRTWQALYAIRDQIVSLQLAPGSGFTEGEIAAQLGLSKTPVREALLMLSADGLVFARPGAGYRVSPVTFKDAKSLCRHRTLLESEAAARAASAGLDSQTAMHLAELVDPKPDADAGERILRSTQFHALLASAVQDKYLFRDLARVLVELERLLRLVARTLELPVDSGHQELLEAVLSGDPQAARASARAHAEGTEKLVLEALLASDVLQGVNLGSLHVD